MIPFAHHHPDIAKVLHRTELWILFLLNPTVLLGLGLPDHLFIFSFTYMEVKFHVHVVFVLSLKLNIASMK